jgi:hypothetical protein
MQPGPIPGLKTKVTSFLDPEGWKTVSLFFLQTPVQNLSGRSVNDHITNASMPIGF